MSTGRDHDRHGTMLTTSLLGVRVHVERSWLLTGGVSAVLCAWAAVAFMPTVGVVGAVAFGAAVAFALSVSLVAHELAHARAAMSVGIQVEHIRLFAGGALCRRRDAIERPRHQFVVAAAGPLASVALGLASLAAVLVVTIFDVHEAIALGFWVVAFANALLAATNLLPVFPFDGAKLIYAMVWRSTRDRRAATDRLRRSGREFARIVMALGVLVMAVHGDLLMGAIITAFGFYLLRLPAPE